MKATFTNPSSSVIKRGTKNAVSLKSLRTFSAASTCGTASLKTASSSSFAAVVTTAWSAILAIPALAMTGFAEESLITFDSFKPDTTRSWPKSVTAKPGTSRRPKSHSGSFFMRTSASRLNSK